MIKRFLFCSLLLVILSGCGGGGGGDGGSTSSTGSTACVWDNPASTWDNCTWGP